MRAWWLVVFVPSLLFAQISQSAPQLEPDYRTDQAGPAKKQEDAANRGKAFSAPLPAAPMPAPPSQQATGEKASMHSNEGRSVLKKAIAPGSWPNWAMVIIAAVTASIAIQTLGTIKTQTKAAKDSADAAKKSADALMIGDRAWVLLEREDIQDKIQAPYLPTAEQMMVEQRMPHCVLFLKNFGKTPAKITALRFELEVSDNPNVPPSNAAYDISGTLNPYMLPQEGCLPYEARLNTQRMEDCDSIRGGVRFLWLFGIIKYTDVFERGPESLHETRFCYVWETRMNASKPFWFSRGDADYNRFT